MQTREDTDTTDESQTNLGEVCVSGVQRLCPKCRHLSPKLIHQQSAEGEVRFTNREVCFVADTLELSPCRHDSIIGTILVTNEILREELNHSQDVMTLEQKVERYRLRLQLENPERYWCWLTIGRVA